MNNITIAIQWSPKVCIDPKDPQLYGIKVSYNNMLKETTNCTFNLTNFIFSIAARKSCINIYMYAMKIQLKQRNYTVFIVIQNAVFCNLTNSAVLNYKSYTCGRGTKNILHISNVTIMQNIGNTNYAMIYIMFSTCGYTEQLDFHVRLYDKQQYNFITFQNCSFRNNSDILSMISILPASTRTITGYVMVNNSEFCYNRNVHFINVNRNQEIIW